MNGRFDLTAQRLRCLRTVGILLPFLLLGGNGLLAAPAASQGTFDAIDQHALAAPQAAEESVESLAAYLTGPAMTETEKSRAIYRWITANVAYNISAYLAGQTGSVEPQGVISSKTAVCEGYSALYAALAKAAGLDVVTITGWAKGYGYHAGDRFEGPTNHAWNAVKIDGQWRLVDSTWGAGYVDSTNTFVRSFAPSFFFAPPGEFIYRHLPQDAQWQLLDQPLSKETFEDLPFAYDAFFRLGLKVDERVEGILQTGKSISLHIEAPENVILRAALQSGPTRLTPERTFVQRRDGRYEVDAVVPAGGRYDLLIFAKDTQSSDDYLTALDLALEASTGDPTWAGFPTAYERFYNEAVSIGQDVFSLQQAGTTTRLSLALPSNFDVWTSLQTSSGRLPASQSFARRTGDLVEVGAVFPGAGSYSLNIYTKQHGDPGDYQQVLKIPIHASSGDASFAGYPVIFPPSARYGVQLDPEPTDEYRVDHSLALTVLVPKGVYLLPVVEKGGVPMPRTWSFSQRDGESYVVSLDVPDPGSYTLMLLARSAAAGSKYEVAVQCGLLARAGSAAWTGYPEVYRDDLQLLTPNAGVLPAGTPQVFHLMLPGADSVMVVTSTGQSRLEKNGDDYTGTAMIGDGPVYVTAQFTGDPKWQGLAKFVGK